MSLPQSKSRELLTRAEKVIPGGVNSPVRAFKGVGGHPVFIARAEGAFLFDADGNRYIDYVASWGPLIFGHRAPQTIEALQQALERGTSFGAPTALEVEIAELIVSLVPSMEMVRMVNSGTEATMSAIRLARAFTGRDLLVKFDGCYHGHADSLLVSAGSGVATLGIPGSPGVPPEVAALTCSVPYNDLERTRALFEEKGQRIAAVIVEPVAGNMGLVLPEPGFLAGLRELCTRFGAVLIFDEVMTGFRVALGGAQERFEVLPDLTTLGKVIGGGLPVGAFGGRREIMEQLAPAGPVYQAGTLSGNPLAMAAGYATLKELQATNPFKRLEELASRWRDGFNRLAAESGVPCAAASCGGMLGLYFTDEPVRSYADAKRSNIKRFNDFFHAMLARGVYLPPSAFEAWFLSTAHDEQIIDATLEHARAVFATFAER